MSGTSLARLGRLALLLAPLLIGAALFITVWSTYRGVATASELLVRGQADLIHDGVRAEIGRQRQLGMELDMGTVLDSMSTEGLVYVAALDGEHVVSEAGKPVSSRAELEATVARTRGTDVVPVGEGRMRSISRRPRRGAAGPRPMALVLEFEPLMAQKLEAGARRTLVVGSLTSGALLLVALALVRWLLLREARERRLEHDRRLASLGQMSAVLAHEIRNPLASLKGNAQLLARALPEAEKTRAKAERVVGEAVRLEKLVNDLLEFARSGALARADVDPAALAREVAAAYGARVAVDADGAPARASLDRERIRQVLANLVDNGLQASEGTVTISVAAAGDALRYAVRDTGPGIAAEDLEHIFEPFFTRRTQGTGLGLAVARRVVEQHGGTLTAHNDPGGGAIFTVDIPR